MSLRTLLAGLVSPCALATAAALPASASAASQPGVVVGWSQDGNGPGNLFDDDLGTRWSSVGEGAVATLDRGQASSLEAVEIAFYKGDWRRARFLIEVSGDGAAWRQLGAERISSGTSLALEAFPAAASDVRYVRITGLGNERNAWTSVTELRLKGPAPAAAAGAPLTVTASHAQLPNVASNVTDGDLATRWSAYGPAVLTAQLGSPTRVSGIEVAFFKGEARRARYAVDVRSDGAWRTVLQMAWRGGTTRAPERFGFAPVVGDVVRLRLEGNSANAWNSVTSLAVVAGQAQATPAANAFQDAALAYAEAMIAEGRDTYGATRSPLFATMLDRRTLSLIERPEVAVAGAKDTNGLRESDRAWNAANPDDHHALYDLLHATGAPGHAEAADAALSWYVVNTAARTGLIPWGEHAAWRLDTDAVTRHELAWADGKHELQTAMTHLWPRLFALAPDEMTRYADAVWAGHVYDEASGLHAHQTRLDGAYADEGWVFARWAGSMVSIWTHAYAAAQDPADRARYLRYVEAVAAGQAARRDPVSGATTDYWRTPTAPGEIGALSGYAPDSDLQGAIEVQRALDLGVLPAGTSARLRDWVARTDATYHGVDHPVKRGTGGAFHKKLDPATLLVTEPPKERQSLWCQSYGRVEPLVGFAGHAMLRHAQSGDARFLAMGRAIGEAYRGESPSCTLDIGGGGPLPLWPEPVARVITLFLDLHEATGDASWLAEAARLGEEAVAAFLDDTSPLPRAFAADPAAVGERAYDHYEAHTGGAELMLALWRLGAATR